MSLETGTGRQDRGKIEIQPNQCKGCGLCIDACPVSCIRLGDALNGQGYRAATYCGQGCTGCGICFYVCPEPGAITVFAQAKAA